MVADELDRLLDRLVHAREPEDVFGSDPAAARRSFRRLARAVHPDKHDGDDRASEAFRRLDALWLRAQALLAAGTYGADRSPTVVVRTRAGREYVVAGKTGADDVCDLFDCSSVLGSAVFKVARHPRDNDLVAGEAATLRLLRERVDERWLPFLPDLLDEVGFRAGGGIVRRALVLRRLDAGFVPLERVLADYPDGLDPRDMAWMWRRLLAVLGATHEAGFVHGAVTPASILVHPEKHGLVLDDWAYAVAFERAGMVRPRAVSRRYRDYYPPELDDRLVGPETDIFMGARTMLALVGGVSSIPPLTLPRPLRAFFRACALPARMRPGDAWDLQQTFDQVLERVYGPRRFRPFSMPAAD